MAASMRCCCSASKIDSLRNILLKESFRSFLSPKRSWFKAQQICQASTTSRQKETNLDYCVNLVRKYDHENYLCTLLYPNEIRTSALAIRAFNVEVAMVQNAVTDKLRGIGRMQFWKDTLERVYKETPPETPVAIELARAVKQHGLSKRWLMRIIEGRASQLGNEGNRTLQEAENYSEDTVSSLYYLFLEALGVKNVHADHAASHIGRSQGLVTLLRATPLNASKGHIYIPYDLLAKHGVSQMDVFRGNKQKEVNEIVYEIACVAKQHLDTARSLKKDVPNEAFSVLKNSIICDRYLQKLEAVNFNVFDKSLQKKDGLLPVRLWLQKYRKTF